MPTETTETETVAQAQKTVLDARDVAKGFGDGAVLEGIDLRVAEGELLTLMGPNGVGKSVLLSCLAGSTDPDAGTIELFDGLSPTEARSETSVALQGETIDPDLTGRENLQFYGDLHPRATDDWREIADRLELTDDLDRPAREYSGGMARKLELTIALTVDAKLYLLDEPTAELDLAMIQTVHDLLLEYSGDGKTILMTSHAPLDAQIADRIAFVQQGRVVATDRPSALLEDLPPTVRVRGGMAPESAFLADRVFQRGDEIRGFLAPETDLETIEGAIDSGRNRVTVERDPPSYTDLFNYYTYVQPTRDAETMATDTESTRDRRDATVTDR
ncbi:ATP-binding cassette domain-containing protein [Natronorubrum sp. JWXQ-INN-674]|uniref:ATP-binding cassette domain-containing protein n=1 Tax=Natronorubrum halalkaliphilum TaxID=2691917 RepID=A0A6B0VMD6_9EURY|nr:ABC transporter ATP-binding protein [Natronorubrum halalkaliphilum]MXV62257.1 ATP-binding cassette domain-containing protein [Natronorubrum halalkaliphilum]